MYGVNIGCLEGISEEALSKLSTVGNEWADGLGLLGFP
jgi:hypothetical protein